LGKQRLVASAGRNDHQGPNSLQMHEKGLGWRAMGAAPTQEGSREHVVWMLQLSWEDSLDASMEWGRTLRAC